MMQTKGEITRRKILESARELFYLNGYTNTSVDDILTASHAKKGNFYFHYRSKEELGFAVLDSFVQEQEAEIQAILSGDGRPLDRLVALFDQSVGRMVGSGCRGGCPVGNFAMEMSDIHDGFRDRVNRVFDRWVEMLRGLFDEARSRGELSPETDGAALARLTVAVWEGAVMLAKAQKDTGVMRDCVRAFEALLRWAETTPRK